MPKIPEFFEIGDNEENSNVDLFGLFQDMYSQLAIAINKKPDVYERTTDGLSSDTFLSNGDININTTTGSVQTLVSRPTSSTVGWSSDSGGGSVAASGRLNGVGGFFGTPFNLASSVHSIIGRYTVTFTTPMSNANYAIVATPYDAASYRFIASITSQLSTGFTVQIYGDTGVQRKPTSINVIVVA